MKNNLGIFVCPSCGGELHVASKDILCRECHQYYKIYDGIPLLFSPHDWDSGRKDVTNIVRSFYEKTPFPNYDEVEFVEDLVRKAQNGIFARLLNEQIPFHVRILEVGCGTGQLSNFLSVAQRTVFATDICLNSLKLGQDFKKNNELLNVGFYQMNLFKPIFKEESFPVVICNGVLHHTSDPFTGFLCISKLVKKGGYIIIGLYNKYGRVITDIRRIIFDVFGDGLKFLDSRLRGKEMGDLKKLTWFLDQYKNPHESKHTIREVLGWFDRTGFDYINGLPRLKAFESFSDNERLFKPRPRGNLFDHFLVQCQLLLTGGKEGGFFLMIGKRNL